MLPFSLDAMKNFAKLTIFLSLTFILTFITAILFGFISFWADSARIISPQAGFGRDFSEIAWTAISVALYFSILLTLSYSARQKIPIPFSILCIVCFALIFTIGTSLGTRRSEALQPAFMPAPQIQAGPGLILSRFDNSIILLRESNDLRGPRLVSIPDRPLIYQEIPLGPNNTILSLPSLPLGETAPWFIRSIGIDFSLSAGQIRTLLGREFYYFAIYILTLILLLSSLRFLLSLSQWPLANIFIAAFVFRLILSLEIFLNSADTNAMICSFLGGRMPPALITPAVFAAIGIVTILYTLLVWVAGNRRSGGRRSGSKSKRDWDD